MSPPERIHHAVQFHPRCRMLLGRSTPCRDHPTTTPFPRRMIACGSRSRTSVICYSEPSDRRARYISNYALASPPSFRQPTKNGVAWQRLYLHETTRNFWQMCVKCRGSFLSREAYAIHAMTQYLPVCHKRILSKRLNGSNMGLSYTAL